MIKFCTKCSRNVIPRVDGTCPGCSELISEARPDLASESSNASMLEERNESDALSLSFNSAEPIAPWVQEEKRTPKDIKRSLFKCKPLSDPGAAFLVSLSTALGTGIGRDLSAGHLRSISLWQLIPYLLPVVSLVNLYILFRLASKPAIFLRAFTRDALSKKERHFLFSCMPKGVKLEGIRAPKQRSALLYRLLIEPTAAFHYFGSPNFSLEGGDHNWLARLLASLSRSRFVIVDVRTVTQHVAVELSVCWKCCGPDRLFFVIDESRTAQEWLTLLSGLLRVPEGSLKESQLLSMPADVADRAESARKARLIREALSAAPAGEIVIGRAAFEKVQEHVPAKAWKTRWSEIPQNQQIAALFLYMMLFGFIALWVPYKLGMIFLPLVMAVLLLIYFVAYGLAIARAFEIAKYDHMTQNPHGLSFGFVNFAALTVVVWIGTMVCAVVAG